MGADDWALCVGISDYVAGNRLPSLPGARRDATRFFDWVTDASGGDVPLAQAKLILSPVPQNGESPQPVAGIIGDWLDHRIRQAIKQDHDGNGLELGRRLYVYVAGHGLALGITNEAGLLVADADPPDVLGHFAPRVWAEWLKAAAVFREVVMFVDCCRSELRKVEPQTLIYPPRQGPHGPARYLYGFAVANGLTAREANVGGVPAGLFTSALLRILSDPTHRPLSASKLKHLLYAAPDLDAEHRPQVQVPDDPAYDFEFLGRLPDAPPAPGQDATWADPATVLVFDDLAETRKLAIGVKLAGGWVSRLDDLDALAERPIGRLVVASEDLGSQAVRDLIATKAPTRVISYSHGTHADQPRWSHVRAHETDLPALATLRVGAVLDERDTATLRITAAEPGTTLHLWGDSGDLLAAGHDQLSVEGVPLGRYRIEARIGASAATTEVQVTGDDDIRVPPVPPATPMPIAGNPRWTDPEREWLTTLDRNARVVILQRRGDDAPMAGKPRWTASVVPVAPGARRHVTALPIEHQPAVVSLPTPKDMRTEVYVDGQDVAIRVAHSSVAVGAPERGDRIRELLRADTALDLKVSATAVVDDPIAALLAMTRHPADSAEWRALKQIAEAAFGPRDPDLLTWDPAAKLIVPPLVAHAWGRSEVKEDSVADMVVGREVHLGPWLSWDQSPAVWRGTWLRSVAGVMWPGWERERESDPEFASHPVTDLAGAAARLRAPQGSVVRRTKKSPPVKLLIKHDVVAFLGGSNDQLAPALAIAFVERGQRSWDELTVWSLEDEALDLMVSDGRRGPRLRQARDRAETELRRLLPSIATRWRLVRYRPFEIGGVWTFASLWDWRVPGAGLIHLSAYQAGQDVRTTRGEDTPWRDPTLPPPPTYQAAVDAYAAIAPTDILAESAAPQPPGPTLTLQGEV